MSYAKSRNEILKIIRYQLGLFPLDNVSDASLWIDVFESSLDRATNRVHDLEQAVRDGEFGDQRTIEQLECLAEQLDIFREDIEVSAEHDITQMVDQGWADSEDEDEIPSFLTEGLASVLYNLEEGVETLESDSKNPDRYCQ